MNDAALVQPASYTQIRVREPAGERIFDDSVSIGGEGAQIVVPGSDAVALRIDRRDGLWTVEPADAAAGVVRFDGRTLSQPRDLRRGDVLGVGEAQVVVTDVSRTLLRIDVRHLVGNATIAPVGLIAALAAEMEDGDLEIRSAAVPQVVESTRSERTPPPGRSRRWWMGAIAAAVLLLGLVLLLSSLESVSLDVLPKDARVSTPGTLLAIRSADRMLMLPGTHTFRAERDGYTPAQIETLVDESGGATARLHLVKLPGRLRIDTGGISASVSIDGAEVGRVPGEVQAAAGRRTVLVRAPRYLDNVSMVDVEGADAVQDLTVKLQPAWGTIAVSSIPAATRIDIDGRDSGIAPASIEVSTGVHRLQLSAPGFRTWESSLVVHSGETLRVGPITLGQPEAQLVVTSTPAGAAVSVAGTFRGHTPATLSLPPGIDYDVVVSLPGRAPYRQTVFADAGRRITVDARLAAVSGRVTIEGEPAGAELFVDGQSRGPTPQTLQLPAIEHRIEVRSDGFVPFTSTVTPAAGIERLVDYTLVPADRGQALQRSAPTVQTKSGYVLRLVPGGRFRMGSDRREQGRRPNEGFRTVTMRRPYYIGVNEVTNAEFRRFRSGHVSGYLEKRSLDLDEQPVTQVTWDDAVEYCNWLSAQEDLPAAYEKSGGRYRLIQPVTTGYRLPTEAEWEFAARYVSPGRVHRFIWGDSLPIAGQIGNLAGAEAAKELPATIEGYQDDYPIAAPVGRFAANPLGLHDMSGNVSEWVNDLYASFVDNSPATDPLGPDQGTRHVIRGASWQSATISDLRLAWRDSAEEINPALGFRIARYAE